jgi:hypothetical protein
MHDERTADAVHTMFGEGGGLIINVPGDGSFFL